MKPLSERDENERHGSTPTRDVQTVGMKPLSERDENLSNPFNTSKNLNRSRNEATLWKRWELSTSGTTSSFDYLEVGMKPLSERDENPSLSKTPWISFNICRNEATLWKRWELPSGFFATPIAIYL